jgi:CheY-like chemotaxis protein
MGGNIQGGCPLQLIVLVVDDDSAVRRSLLRLLRTHGHIAVGARSGAEALRKAQQCTPAVILMDLLLPAQDGIDAAWALRRHPDLSRVPIIALTASPEIAAHAVGLFHEVLSKPCPAQILLHAIDAACRQAPA